MKCHVLLPMSSAAVVIGALRLILCMLGNFACFCFLSPAADF